MNTALIVGRKNGAGLDQDAMLVADVLRRDGWSVRHYAPREWRGLFTRQAADVVIHLERVFPLWRWKAKRHVLIPNQERFPRRHKRRLRHIDHVLCKSRHAEAVFSTLHPSVHLIGFTSPDRLLPAGAPDYSRFFHLAGRSTLKGTETILELWRKHPEWPGLTLVQHPDNAPTSVPPNVELISRVMEDDDLRRLQNQCGIHLCPSVSEGWGHYIVEAMSCRAVVVTTDAPPMNELVQPGRGVLVIFERTEPRHLGVNFYVEAASLERAITELIALAGESKTALGNAARHWFEDNNQAFGTSLRQTIRSLMA